jgi:hypothetical protein
MGVLLFETSCQNLVSNVNMFTREHSKDFYDSFLWDFRISHMRIDALSIMLNLANVSALSKLLVVDDTGGFIIACILDRVGSEYEISCTLVYASVNIVNRQIIP